ncbi:ABC transporter permease [Clostridium nigeriense]|uniref:ABC transporter permease n=1 Tax=Clostridium nigeriense TaxID=1805470 RepID=UPI0008301DF6|nr:FtsX-like permease family protein [Clostridium nigeriense]
MSLPFKISLRFLKSSKGQTILIAIGIAIGISVQIFIGSLITGLQKSLINKTIGNSPQIKITSTSNDNLISNYNELTENINNINTNITNLSTVADGAALTKANDKTYSVLIRGMNIDASDKIYNIKDRIYEGREVRNDFETLIGKDLKEELNLTLGDNINIISNSGANETLKIVGFYDLGVASINKSWLITTINTSQNIFSFGDNVTSIEMQTNDLFNADVIASDLGSKLDDTIKISNWKDDNAELLSGLNGQSISSIMIQIFVLVSVVLGIASVLAITVLQKSKQIAILKAMGIKDKDASLIFLFEGFLLGIIGAFIGVILGLLLSYLFSKFALNPDGTPIVKLYIDYKFIAFSALIAILSSTIASLIPAIRSSKLNLLEVIKNG